MPLLNPNLSKFWQTKARNRVLYGGRASSKSHDAAGVSVHIAQDCTVRILCVRQQQNKIEESVYTLLKSKIFDFGYRDRFRILENKIICTDTGSEYMFYGLWRHIDEIKSLEGIDILWIEEAHNLTEEQWKILEPTIRKEGSEVWVIFNPKLLTDFAYQRFVVNPPPNTIVRKINYDENIFLSSTMLDIIAAAKLEDHDNYLHIYRGEPLIDDEGAIIRRSWLLAAVDGHKKLGIDVAGSKRIGFDVADAGEDACATVGAYGSLAVASDLWKAGEDQLLQSCSRVWAKARNTGSEIIYDAIGVGATAGAKFNELNTPQVKVEHTKFFAGGSVVKPDQQYAGTGIKNKDYFSNVKSQAWQLVADRLRNTYNAVQNGQKFELDEMIFLDSGMDNLNKLIDELSTPKKDFDLAGRIKVESKKDLAKREVASPNLADAFIMAFLPGQMKKRSWFG